MMLQVQVQEQIQKLHFNELVKAIKGDGVISGLEVTAAGGMDLNVSAGEAIIGGTRISYSATTVTIPAADQLYPRKDLVVAKSDGSIAVVQGTPDSPLPSDRTGVFTVTPRPPDPPSGSIILAEVWIPAGATEITSAYITDRRIFVREVAVTLSALEIDADKDWNDKAVTNMRSLTLNDRLYANAIEEKTGGAGINLGAGTLFVDQADGRVGVGTASPEDKLHVAGGSILLDNNQRMKWKDSSGTVHDILCLGPANTFWIKCPITTTGVAFQVWTRDADGNLRTRLGMYGGQDSPYVNLQSRAASSDLTKVNSPILNLYGYYWNGSASKARYARLQQVITSTAPSSELRINVAGSNRMIIKDNDEIVPRSDNVGKIGTDSLRWNLVRAETITSGDLKFARSKGQRVIEEKERFKVKAFGADESFTALSNFKAKVLAPDPETEVMEIERNGEVIAVRHGDVIEIRKGDSITFLDDVILEADKDVEVKVGERVESLGDEILFMISEEYDERIGKWKLVARNRRGRRILDLREDGVLKPGGGLLAEDILFSSRDRFCPICGKRFEVGDIIALRVSEFLKDGSFKARPVHLKCAG